MKGGFRSIYQPFYQPQGWTWAEFTRRYQKALCLALLLHALVAVFLLFKPSDVSFNKAQEVVIEVSSSMVIPDGQPEAEVKKEPPPKPAPAEQNSPQPTTEFKTKASPKPKKNAPTPAQKIENKEEAPKPPTLDPVKEQPEPPKKVVEPVKEEPVKVEPVIKEAVVKEEKKEITLQKQDKPPEKPPEKISEKPTEKPLEKPQDKPVLPVKIQPVLADKRNKEKDAPELPPASAAPSAPASASSSASSTSSSSEQPQASSAAAASGAGARSDASPAASSATLTSIQAVPAGPALAAPAASTSAPVQGILGGANTEAQYNLRELNNKMPPYPLMAKKMRQEGTVVLVVEVLENGTAGEIRIAVTSGSELLDKVSLETVKRWSFQPARKEGVAHVQKLRIPITFKL